MFNKLSLEEIITDLPPQTYILCLCSENDIFVNISTFCIQKKTDWVLKLTKSLMCSHINFKKQHLTT